jgi:hypothetical protein
MNSGRGSREAVTTTIYVFNQSLTKGVVGKIPFEAGMGKSLLWITCAPSGVWHM